MVTRARKSSEATDEKASSVSLSAHFVFRSLQSQSLDSTDWTEHFLDVHVAQLSHLDVSQ